MKQLLLIVLLCCPSWSQIALVAHTATANSTSGVATTSAINTTGANLIVVWTYGKYNTGVPSDSAHNTWTAVSSVINVASNYYLQMFYCYSPTVSSSHTFTSTGPSYGYASVAVAAFSGVSANPLDQQSQFSEASAASPYQMSPGSITPTQNNELVFLGASTVSNTMTVDASMTLLDAAAGVGALLTAYKVQTTAAAINPVVSNVYASNYGTVQQASFKAPSASGRRKRAIIIN
jgi:hypothetical protein